MPKTINKYSLAPTSTFGHSFAAMIPETAKVLTVDTTGVGLQLWAEVDMMDAEPTREITYLAVPTGEAPPEEGTDWEYMKTVILHDFHLVWHIYQQTAPSEA